MRWAEKLTREGLTMRGVLNVQELRRPVKKKMLIFTAVDSS
jgi:hypothetical protein